TETASPSISWAASQFSGAGWPVRFADDTAMGPTSVSSSMATGCSGMRTATVPRVSPRSHWRDGWCLATRVSAPGQKASTRSQACSEKSVTSPCSVFGEPISTGVGMVRPRPLACSRSPTASAVKASAPMPYTVSVGSTTSSPRRTADAASRRPVARSVTSLVSYRRAMGRASSYTCCWEVESAGRSRQCLARGGEPGAVVQVGVVGGVRPAAVLGEDPRHLAALGVRVLDDDHAAGAQQPVRGAFQAADQVQAVLAGEEGQPGVVVAGLGGDVLPLGERDVGRVGDDQVDLAVEVGEGGQGVALPEVDPRPLHVAAGPAQRVLGELHGVHARARHLLGEGERDGARAGAQVDDARLDHVHRAHGVYGPADDRLGLRARHEHAGADLEFQVAEVGVAGDVLERFARLAAGDDLPVPGVEVGVGHVVQLAALDAVHERGELLRVGTRRGHAGVGEPLGGLGHLGEQQVHWSSGRGYGAYAAASLAAESASTQAWITAARSPSRTWSRLYALKPTRWSEMRFSG